jgi:hypothetical protein
MFSVDADFRTVHRRISNRDVVVMAARNRDIILALTSIAPHRDKQGPREARWLGDFERAGFAWRSSRWF